MTIPIIILLNHYSVQGSALQIRIYDASYISFHKVGSCGSPEDNTLLTEPIELYQETTGSNSMLRGSLSNQF